MPTVSESTVTIALVGNPNTGKSTLFNALSGVRQRVGNYPGVTVEKKIGHMQHGARRYALVDLPGTYSLAPRSPDEMVAVDVLLGRQPGTARPHGVLCIVDASNLERNLYLVSQVLELELPTVVALNMTDVARERGIELDLERLQKQLGVPVVPVQANRRVGLDALKTALDRIGSEGRAYESPFPEAFRAEVRQLGETLTNGDSQPLPRYLVERILLDTTGYLEEFVLRDGQTRHTELHAARERLKAAGCPVPAVEAMARYGWVAKVLDGVVTRPTSRPITTSDRIDKIITHRLWGSVLFLLMMFIVFQSVFLWPAPQLMSGIDTLTGQAAALVEDSMSEGPLRSLLVDGVIGGVGGVIIFLPQILLLFFFIGVLEDCGYMARAAYLMDKLMSAVGLNGKSFIPLLSSFACAIPGIMAARVIETRRDRLTTILVAPLMSCSARLPVYILFTAAFIPPIVYAGGWITLAGLVMMGMYLLGIVMAVLVALVLKKTLLRGPTPPFVMELPSYKWPSPQTVGYRMAASGWAFLVRAGTLIVAVSIIVWAGLYYPHNADEIEGPYRDQIAALETVAAALPEESPERAAVQEQLDDVENHVLGLYHRQSYLGRLGHMIEPLVKPLGWDWRIGVAAIASFPAREVIVATLGIIYDLGSEVDIDDDEGRSRMSQALHAATWDGTDRPVFNLPVALSIMVFFALCAQCASTLVIMKRETGGWGWPAFTFVYMTTLAYVGAFITYQVGMWLS